MANQLVNGPAVDVNEPARAGDTRVWMYRDGDDGLESQLFAHPDDVPDDEGWRDSPVNPAAKVARAGKPKA